MSTSIRSRTGSIRARAVGLRDLTVTPAAYARAAYLALGALTLIVLSGAAVRLTGSGLGCPDWPRCYGKAYPPLNGHAVIEFSNRVITTPVALAALAAWVLALRRRPYRRDLAWLAALLPVGVLGQAVLGGFTVRGNLDYGFVMGHFALSMLILAAAAALAWRATYEPGVRERTGDRATVWAVRGLVGLAGLVVLAGTAATAAGPHAGGAPGQRINRLAFDGKATMDFVIHRHAELGLGLGVAAIVVWWLARRRPADPLLRRALTMLCLVMAAQGAVGMVQYETHLPGELVWVHVALACAVWLSALWAVAAAGQLAPRPRKVTGETAAHGARAPA